ncbi:MAG TPA: GGDEF domain-containing protein [Acidimicrobiales bacterium]|nr:GGDEF domain-containing protein [Acidimicrobiales bacterium]
MPRLAPLRAVGRNDEPSLEERFGLLGAVRAGLALAVVLAAWGASVQVGLTPGQAALPCAALVAFALPVTVAGRYGRAAALGAQRVGLAGDVAFLLVVSAPQGGARSGLLVLFSLHLVAVATLASGPAALQVALWDVAGTIVLATTGLDRAICAGLGVPTPTPPPAGAIGIAVAGFVAVAALTAGLGRVSERELRRSRSELQALATMAADLERRTDPADVAAALLRATTRAIGARRGALVLPDAQHLVLEAPDATPSPFGDDDDDDDALLAAARAQGVPLARRWVDPAADHLAADLLPAARGVVAAPLGTGPRQPVLLLELGGRRGLVARRTLLVAGQFAAHGAVALASTALLAERERLAAVDGLTGLANRRAFDTGLDREVAGALRRGEPLSLVLIDIDHFKRVNDTRGHTGGDEVLRAVAGVLAAACRTQDLVARYGGEEFAVVLPGCPAEAARVIVERARRAMAAEPLFGGVTVSAGVATLPDHAGAAVGLVEAADAALYAAKAAGRDRVTVAPRVA